MPTKVTIVLGPKIPKPKTPGIGCEVEIISSQNDEFLSLDSLRSLGYTPDLLILRAHGDVSSGKFNLEMFEFDGETTSFAKQIAMVQEITGARNICVLGCRSARGLKEIESEIDLAAAGDESSQGLKFLPGKICTFSSSKYVSMMYKNDLIVDEILNNGGEIDSQTIPLKYSVPYQALEILEDDEQLSSRKQKYKPFVDPHSHSLFLSHDLGGEEQELAKQLNPHTAFIELAMRGEFDVAKEWFDKLRLPFTSSDPEQLKIAGESYFASEICRYYNPNNEDSEKPEKLNELTRILSAALSHGILDPNAKGFLQFQSKSEGRTFFAHAIRIGFAPLVATFLENGANPNLENDKGLNYLTIAAITPNLDVIDVITAHPSTLNQTKLTTLDYIMNEISKGELEEDEQEKFEQVVKTILKNMNSKAVTDLHDTLGEDDPLLPFVNKRIETINKQSGEEVDSPKKSPRLTDRKKYTEEEQEKQTSQ